MSETPLNALDALGAGAAAARGEEAGTGASTVEIGSGPSTGDGRPAFAQVLARRLAGAREGEAEGDAEGASPDGMPMGDAGDEALAALFAPPAVSPGAAAAPVREASEGVAGDGGPPAPGAPPVTGEQAPGVPPASGVFALQAGAALEHGADGDSDGIPVPQPRRMAGQAAARLAPGHSPGLPGTAAQAADRSAPGLATGGLEGADPAGLGPAAASSGEAPEARRLPEVLTEAIVRQAAVGAVRPSGDQGPSPQAAAGAGAAAPFAASPPAGPVPGDGMPVQGVPDDALWLGRAVDDPRWADGLGERITWMAGRGLHQATLRLNPPQLGSLEIRLSVSPQDGQTTVAFHVQNPDARDALQAALPRLREMMAEAGLQLADAAVSYQDRGGMARDGQGGVTPGGLALELAAAAEGAGGEPQPSGSSRIVRGLLDTYA